MRVLCGLDELVALKGRELGRSPWLTLDPARVERFRSTTEAPIGYLALSLIPALSQQIWQLEGITFAVNAGLNRVRVSTPVEVGARLQLRSTVLSVRAMTGGAHLVMAERLHDDVHDRPLVDAETVTLLRF